MDDGTHVVYIKAAVPRINAIYDVLYLFPQAIVCLRVGRARLNVAS
jgi:hypothetical protein